MKPRAELQPNSYEFETQALVKPTGFREYDARWWFGQPASDKQPELNLLGVQALGMGLGTLIRRLGVGPKIVVGHDFRGYSLSIKLALAQGLMAAGADVKDIGLALSVPILWGMGFTFAKAGLIVFSLFSYLWCTDLVCRPNHDKKDGFNHRISTDCMACIFCRPTDVDRFTID